MLEKLLAAEVLEIRVLHPAIAQSLVGKVVAVLEDRQPCHQPRRQRRLARLVRVDRTESFFQKTPVDRPCQLHQRVVHVDDLIKPCAEQILLAALPPLAWSHRKPPRFISANGKNHGFRFEGILKIKFARKSPCKGQKPANSITSTRPIAQPIQWVLNSSRTTRPIHNRYRCSFSFSGIWPRPACFS